MTREESRLGPSQRAGCQRLRDSSTTRVGSRAVIPSPRLSARRCSRTRPCCPSIVRTAKHRGGCPRPSQAMRSLGESYSGSSCGWRGEPLGRAGAIASRRPASGSLSEQMLFPAHGGRLPLYPLRFDLAWHRAPCEYPSGENRRKPSLSSDNGWSALRKQRSFTPGSANGSSRSEAEGRRYRFNVANRRLAVIADRAVNVEVSGCGLRRARR
jgi:hypothetical protein